MRTQRIEVRLEPETREKLEEVAAARGATFSELVRSLIESSYEEEMSGRRLAAAERLGAMEVEDVPDTGVLKRQFGEAHDARDAGA